MPPVLSKPNDLQAVLIDSLYKNLKKTKLITGSVFLIIALLIKLRISRASLKNSEILTNPDKGKINLLFFKQILNLFKILFKGMLKSELYDPLYLLITLIFRTLLSVYLANVNGKIVKALINKDSFNFWSKLFNLALCAIPASFLNLYIEFLKKKMIFSIRSALTNYFHNIYLSKMAFYDLSFLENKSHDFIESLLKDIELFSSTFSSIFTSFFKPLFDIICISKVLSVSYGWKGPYLVLLWYFISGNLLRLVTHPMGLLIGKGRLIENRLKNNLLNIVCNSEQLAFYRSEKIEKQRLIENIDTIKENSQTLRNKQLLYNVCDGVFHKYSSVLSAWLMLSWPIFGSKREIYLKNVFGDSGNIIKDFAKNSILLINMRKVKLFKYLEIEFLSGYTRNISEAFTEIEQFNTNELRYKKYYIKEQDKNSEIDEVIENSLIEFNKIPLITPLEGNVFSIFEFQLKQGMNTVFSGPLGSGKTGIFRLLFGVWPLSEGTLTRPSLSKILYINSKFYMPKGNLRDLIIYPDSMEEMNLKGVKDNNLQTILERVKLHYLVDKEGGFDVINDWDDCLDLSEKQMICLARILYNVPEFVVLDECIFSEPKLFYSILKEYNITYFTITHHFYLFPYHNFLFRIDSEGNWSLEKFKIKK